MGWLLRTAVQFRLLVLGVAAAVLAVGVVQLPSAPVDVLPEFTPPYAEVQTEALGLSAEEVEQLITVPLEADLLNGVEGIDVIRSESVPGLSSIVMVFERGTDIYQARQLIEERLTQAHALPNVSKPPNLLQPLSTSNRVLMIGLSSDEVTPIEQSVIARWTVRPRLMGVPGVANVSVWGMRDQQLQVQVDPQRLQEQGITLNQVIRSAGNAQVVSPLSFLEASTPGTGGFVETPQQRLQVRHLLEKIADPAELGKVPVDGTNGRLRLSDVATITVDHQPLIGDAVVSGGTGLVLLVEKFPGTSVASVTEGVEDALESLKPGLTGIQTDTSVFRPASYVEDAMDNLGLVLLVGGLLVLLVLLAFGLQWRAVLMALVTVPLSLMTAALVLDLLGHGFNAIVFAGLAAAVAVLVDEAVAPSERVVRRLRERAVTEGRPSLATVVREASGEIRRPLTYALLIVLLAVVPVAVLGGRPGAFLAPMVLAYALAVASATLVALTVTPALSMILFARWKASGGGSKLQGRAQASYATALRRFSGSVRVPLIAAGACVLVGLATLPLLGMSLIPTFQDRDVLVRLESAPGTSNTRMTAIATEVTKDLAAIPGVESVGAHVGRAVGADRVTNVNSSDVWLNIDQDADYDATMAAVRTAVGDVQDVRSEVVTYSAQKLRDVGALNSGENPVRGNDLDVLTGVDKPLVVRLYGQDLGVLRQQAQQVKELMAGVDGVVRPRIDLPEQQPTIEIEVDLDKAQEFGVTPGDVRRAEATLVQGIQVGSIFQQQKVFDVIVQGTPDTRGGIEAIRNMLIDRPDGGYVTLGQVADVRQVDTPAVVSREAVSRRLDIEAGVSGRSVAAVAADVKKGLAATQFPIEYHAEVLSQGTSEEIGATRFLGFTIAVLVAALLLVQAAVGSWRLAGLVMACLPVSLIGGLLVALADGAELSLGSLIGLLAVFGLATRASLVLVADVQAGERGAESPADLVRSGAGGRLVPVVTSAVAIAALVLPIVILGGRPGLELLQPMSLVILGGLVTTGFTTLFLLPALYLHLAPPAERSVTEDERVLDRTIVLEPSGAAATTWPRQRAGSVSPSGEESVR